MVIKPMPNLSSYNYTSIKLYQICNYPMKWQEVKVLRSHLPCVDIPVLARTEIWK